tara:strand:- start:8 stop:232 length:225 start_codon:yes stop_codon:yes gene_type:complete
MSHFSNDIAVDRVISDVADMSDVDVVKALNPANMTKVAGFTGNKVNGANIIDFARDVLADQMLDDWVNMPGPCG